MAKARGARAAAAPLTRSSVERFLLSPLVVFLITFGVRAALFLGRYRLEPYVASPVIPHPTLSTVLGGSSDALQSAYTCGGAGMQAEQLLTPPPIHFSMSIPATEAATWREVVYWRERGFATEVPPHLQTLAPWYTRFIPAVLAAPPVTGLVLSAMDGVTAAMISRWSSTTAALLYAFFVLNPLLALTTASESLTSFEVLLLTATVHLCAHRRSCSPLLHVAAVGCGLVLGSPFLAIPVVLLAPLGTRSYRLAFAGGAALTAGVGAYAVLYLDATEASHRAASMYAPPDNGVMWYVRQLVLPSFERCLEIFMLQLAPMLLIPACVALPTAYARPPARGATAHPHLFTDGRVFLLLMAEGLSALFRPQLTLPYCCVVVLHFYCCLNPAASKTVTLEDKRVVTYSPYMRVRLLVPIFIQLTSIPLEVSFYVGWAVRETANANWKFFSDVAFMVGAMAFLVLWYAEVTDDAVLCDADDAPPVLAVEGSGTAAIHAKKQA